MKRQQLNYGPPLCGTCKEPSRRTAKGMQECQNGHRFRWKLGQKKRGWRRVRGGGA